MNLENIKRKIYIRKEAYRNMTGVDENNYGKMLSEEETEKLLKSIYYNCQQLDEYACLKIFGDIHARNKMVYWIKKVLRKICFKLMGWYYVPIIEGQIDFNRYMKQILADSQQLNYVQQEEINELKRQVEKLQG
jgi:hypothetical protein